MAMAIRDSVTVSIAALASGTFERDVAGEAGRDVDRTGQDLGMPGHEQDVVERERGL